MKQKINGWWAWVLGGVVSLLGFSACTNKTYMYGPLGDETFLFTVDGEVVDTDGQHLRGIRMVVAPDGLGEGSEISRNDTLYTNYYGKASQKYYIRTMELSRMEVKFEDAELGLYEAQTIRIAPLVDDNEYHSGVSLKVEMKKK